MSLDLFHSSVRTWFAQHLGDPTPAQADAWPAIAGGKHTLIAAPTGSGKTLAAFLSAINDLTEESLKGTLPDETRVVYLSPLKALSNDINRNLEVPLKGINEELEKQGLSATGIRVAVRTGDTPPSERQEMLKHPPHILVTTPESLYILLTSENGRKMLGAVRTLIIDEIHAVLGDKRGAHLALSVERLQHLVGHPIQRIGLSATQRPIEQVAQFLSGTRGPGCVIVDSGHRRKLDITLEVPKSPLTAVMANEVWGEIYERIVELTKTHATTIIFVNTRRLAERLAHHLSDILGEGAVTSHHGSMSKEHRHDAEQRLKHGKLKVLVATASMELGIDVGSVELVIQIASPHGIAAFLQRVGRSRHQVGGLPKGIIFPLTRDDMVECTALLYAVKQGDLDKIVMPEKPLDILAQQIVAEVATGEYDTNEMFELVTSAYPYRELTRKEFDDVIHMVAEGFTSRRGRRGAYIYHDVVNNKLRPRKGARLTALTAGGAIADTFDYEVVLEPENVTLGSINEDFALESLPGDIFQLGNHPWQIIRIQGLSVRVQDAGDQQPNIPFWFGERPGRTIELSEAVSNLRERAGQMLDADPPEVEVIKDADGTERFISKPPIAIVRWLTEETGITAAAAEQLVLYLAAGKNALGLMPSVNNIVMERFFDEAGDMHLVIHSPFGSRVNKGWGLALRKKFCRNFNFELQAAANEDSIVISLSSSHSFPIDEVFRYLNERIVRNTLIQAMLDAPMFEVRWRWNASRALAVLRSRAGKRVAPQLQRMASEDLIAQCFPDQIACLENIQGDREIPDHPLVNQTIHDCLTEAMDIDSLEALIGRIERKELNLVALDLREPSPFAQEIINARPYAFLDDTPFEERRVNAIKSRRWLDPADASELATLDPQAIRQVEEEAWPTAESSDELGDVLQTHGFITQAEGIKNHWKNFFNELTTANRAAAIQLASEGPETTLWISAERIPQFKAVYPEAVIAPLPHLPERITAVPWEEQGALKEIVRGRMECCGPVTAAVIAQDMLLPVSKVDLALLALEAEGFVFRGHFNPGTEELEWCERRLLHRIHRYTLDSLRQSIQPVSLQDYMRYLFRLHNLKPSPNATGPAALQTALNKLEGYEAPAASWEADLIPARIADYDPSWLDVLCISGKFSWGRFSHPKGGAVSPVKSTPVCITPRSSVDLWLSQGYHNGVEKTLTPQASLILEALRSGGAMFFDDIAAKTQLLGTQVEKGISELVAAGLVNCDSFSGLRALLTPSYNKPGSSSRRSKAVFGIEHAGRWTLLPSAENNLGHGNETLERLIHVYLQRYGVISRKALERESHTPPWRILVRALRRMEMKGTLRGGRFIAGISAEQYALPETVDLLRKIRKEEKKGEYVAMSAVDPCNQLGILLPGKKVANLASNRVLYRDGVPVAILEGKEPHFLIELPAAEKWEAQKLLIQRNFPPMLRAYLGKSYI